MAAVPLIEHRLPGGADRPGVAVMHLVRRHQRQPGVAVLGVVPGEEGAAERPVLLQRFRRARYRVKRGAFRRLG